MRDAPARVGGNARAKELTTSEQWRPGGWLNTACWVRSFASSDRVTNDLALQEFPDVSSTLPPPAQTRPALATSRDRRDRVGSSALSAGVVKLADTRDSKSREAQTSCGFDPRLRHHILQPLPRLSASARTRSQPQMLPECCPNSPQRAFGPPPAGRLRTRSHTPGTRFRSCARVTSTRSGVMSTARLRRGGVHLCGRREEHLRTR